MRRKAVPYEELLIMTGLKVRKCNTARRLVIPTEAMLPAAARQLAGADRSGYHQHKVLFHTRSTSSSSGRS
jgi:hypothetical protein